MPPLEQKVKPKEERSWITARLGSFESCYIGAKAGGYRIVQLVQKGIKLHIDHSENWATITQAGRSGKSWELVYYNYCPESNEPIRP